MGALTQTRKGSGCPRGSGCRSGVQAGLVEPAQSRTRRRRAASGGAVRSRAPPGSAPGGGPGCGGGAGTPGSRDRGPGSGAGSAVPGGWGVGWAAAAPGLMSAPPRRADSVSPETGGRRRRISAEPRTWAEAAAGAAQEVGTGTSAAPAPPHSPAQVTGAGDGAGAEHVGPGVPRPCARPGTGPPSPSFGPRGGGGAAGRSELPRPSPGRRAASLVGSPGGSGSRRVQCRHLSPPLPQVASALGARRPAQ